MLNEIRRDNCFDDDLAFDENRTSDLRCIIAESIDLPDEVLRADFSHIHDRILDQDILSGLISPSTTDAKTGDWTKRRHDREKALIPYLGRRLVCVCIRLPGVRYTIEVDPEADMVIHWEWQLI